MLDNTYFTRREAFEDIKNCLENDYEGYLCELHNEVFNTDYYIAGRKEAKQALSSWEDENGWECDAFGAIERIKEYEQNTFGEVNTDFSNPERVANMLYYIVGDDAIGFLCEKMRSIR